MASASIQCLHCKQTIRRCTCKWEADHKARIIVTLARDADGRYPQRTRTVTGTKKQVQAAAQKFAQQHQHRAPTRTTVSDLCDRWLAHITARDRAATTLYNYRNRIRHDIKPTLGNIELQRLTVTDLDRLYTAMSDRKKGGSPASIRQVHAILRAALNYAIKRDLVDRNVAESADIPDAKPHKVAPPTPEQVMVILDRAMSLDRDLGMALRLSATTGARRGSVAAVRYSHLNVTDRYVVIERSIAAIPGRPIEDKGLKHGRGGPVPVDEDTMVLLEAHIAHLAERARLAGTELVDDFYLFSTRADCAAPIRPDSLTAGFERVRELVGLPKVRLHDLRHFAATQLIGSFDAVTVANRLHHASPKLTMDTYAHLIPEQARAAGDAIGEVLRPKPAVTEAET